MWRDICVANRVALGDAWRHPHAGGAGPTAGWVPFHKLSQWLAYSLFEVPSGWMADVIGSRRVLTRIVLWWSGFTVLTGAAWNYASLLIIRFLFGAGEAGAFPGMARALSRWSSP